MKKMAGRAPGGTCINSMSRINADGSNWQCIGFSGNGGGCGAAMRSACIGLVFW